MRIFDEIISAIDATELNGSTGPNVEVGADDEVLGVLEDERLRKAWVLLCQYEQTVRRLEHVYQESRSPVVRSKNEVILIKAGTLHDLLYEAFWFEIEERFEILASEKDSGLRKGWIVVQCEHDEPRKTSSEMFKGALGQA